MQAVSSQGWATQDDQSLGPPRIAPYQDCQHDDDDNDDEGYQYITKIFSTWSRLFGHPIPHNSSGITWQLKENWIQRRTIDRGFHQVDLLLLCVMKRYEDDGLGRRGIVPMWSWWAHHSWTTRVARESLAFESKQGPRGSPAGRDPATKHISCIFGLCEQFDS